MVSGKRAFVSGASRGIGRGLAKALASDGFDLAFTYNTQLGEAQTLKEEIEGMGRRAFYYQASMQEADVPRRIIAQAIEDLGGIDACICNAGLTVHNDILTLEDADIEFAYRLDFASYIQCAEVAARHMIKAGVKGDIVFITSTRGLRAYPEDPLYGGMKAALNRICESLALEWSRYGIRVNCIAPGATAVRGTYTEEELTASPFARQIPAGRFGSPDEVGGLLSYLLSDNARYINGTVIRMDGGLILPAVPQDGSEETGTHWFDKEFRVRSR